ncbi:hypothetical protein C7E17_26235, partial [Stenotrophomonas maltophilia]
SLARPVEVLAGERLDEQKAGTLGDTVAKLPGVREHLLRPGVAARSLARPVEVLAGERLDEQKAGTLGDTVAKLPGVR